MEYVLGVIEENTKLRNEIQQITQKYLLLTETYPNYNPNEKEHNERNKHNFPF